MVNATLNVEPGHDITCVYTNTANEPRLVISKSAFDATGTKEMTPGDAIEQGTTISYRLTFDNVQGTAAMSVDHLDVLGDVPDDAQFVSGSVRLSDGSESGYPAVSMNDAGILVESLIGGEHADNPRLAMTGTVPRGP